GATGRSAPGGRACDGEAPDRGQPGGGRVRHRGSGDCLTSTPRRDRGTGGRGLRRGAGGHLGPEGERGVREAKLRGCALPCEPGEKPRGHDQKSTRRRGPAAAPTGRSAV